MASEKKYRVWCVTDDQWEETGWVTQLPTQCPVNPEHTINLNKIKTIRKFSGMSPELFISSGDTISSTTSQLYQPGGSLTTSDLEGTYMLSWFFEVARSGGGSLIEFKVTDEDDRVTLHESQRYYINQAKAFVPISGFALLSFSKKPKKFVIWYRNVNSKGVILRNPLLYLTGPIST